MSWNTRRGRMLPVALTWALCGPAWGQVCPIAPGPGGGISITSPSPNAPFLSGQSVQVTISASGGFTPTQIVAQ
jgi:hypothetical protein